MKTLTADQLTGLSPRGQAYRRVRDVLLELATGLRRGELLGLKWQDVDFNQGTITVRRQISRINGTVVEAPLKTKNAYRVIPLGEQAWLCCEASRRKPTVSMCSRLPTAGPSRRTACEICSAGC